jgi:putative membrane protein insertion efficiency factor
VRQARKNGLAARAVAAPIRFYRRFLSPLKPPSCRFTPTCSAYALEAIGEHGVGRGLWLTLRRLARCQPITFLGGSSGFDPVPHSHSKLGHTHSHHGHP